MAVLCNLECGETLVKPLADYSECIPKFRRYGYSHFVLLACDTAFDDITDPLEWEAKVLSDDVHISPRGILNIGQPEGSSFVYDGCGNQAIGSLTYPITFETYMTKDDLSDFLWMENLMDNYQNFRIILRDCNDIFHLEDNFTLALRDGGSSPFAGLTNENPGFVFSITSPPLWEQGEQDNGKWTITFQVIKQGIFRGVFLPGVSPVLA
jgi:hypothetical protein